jgi:hypothetical protein
MPYCGSGTKTKPQFACTGKKILHRGVKTPALGMEFALSLSLSLSLSNTHRHLNFPKISQFLTVLFSQRSDP